MRQVRVIADHIWFEGELLPREQWEAFDLLYGCMEHLPENDGEHILLLGVRCGFSPGKVQEKPFVFIHQRSIQSILELPEP
ncbi:hypothetical protein [Deinococcus cellulosilyticus]|uniref:Uncharacterized protein n=1 Tax=Deinococcus cellulosilyticus (strain DSM 18568 / NBRC 106333 / KACC 11606 / 5516J-15) TaxID=1223518 RepID=A0A511N1I7_DEIC1|nr:hypothetical protein [Deinococcus cellulosilyticus]GEM46734.1 hypothetical protein DC3_23690 [Deinococcus cellulosilyticus NBRC 106333 = KACC 11606]